MNAQKVNTVVTICAAFLPAGSVITMMTVKTIQMNVIVVCIAWMLPLTCSYFISKLVSFLQNDILLEASLVE